MSPSERQPWIVVGIGFVVLACSFGARSLLGLTMPALEADLGWSRSLISTGAAIALVVMAIVAPIAGALIDRFGARLMLSIGLAMIGFGMIGAAVMTEPWQFFLLFGLLAGVGFGTAANHTVSTIVSRRFERNRGLAVGAATSGSSGGQLIIMPVLAILLSAFDWRWSYLALAASCFVLIPLVWTASRPAPAGGATLGIGGRLGSGLEPLGVRLRELARDRTFLLLFAGFFICGITTTGVIETHLLPYAAACGFPPLEGATAYGLLSAFNVAGMVLAGLLTDRMHRPLLLGIIYILRGLTFVVLMQIVDDLPLLIIFAVAFGLVDYSTLVVTAHIVASHIGVRKMGLAMGILSSSHSIGGAIGAFAAGYLYDLFAQYDWVWIASILLAILAGFLSFGIRESDERRGRWIGRSETPAMGRA